MVLKGAHRFSEPVYDLRTQLFQASATHSAGLI